MRRRYREGVQVTKREFNEQPWACGMLTLEQREGRARLGLWSSVPDVNFPPLGLLWRPEIAACAHDTISFAGAEKIGERWFYQVWYCEIGGPPRE
jgi:hypothetical protein